jgi:hypothetical protein
LLTLWWFLPNDTEELQGQTTDPALPGDAENDTCSCPLMRKNAAKAIMAIRHF